MDYTQYSDDELRALYKKYDQQAIEYNSKQNALKVLLNGGYGALANQYFRWFDYDIAESITITGQYIIQTIAKHMNMFMNKILKTTDIDYVIAIDTDSCYLNVEKIVDRLFPDSGTQGDITEFLVKFANQVETLAIDEAFKEIYTQTNAFDECLHMKLETIGQAVWKAAKMYIVSVWYNEGVTYETPDIKMQGIAAVKSSTPAVCRKYIKDAIPFIVAKDSDSFHRHAERCRDEFFKMSFAEVAIPGGITDINKWIHPTQKWKKGVPYRVRGALTYNSMIKRLKLENIYHPVSAGEKSRLCYLLTPNPSGQNLIVCPDELPPELGLEQYIDYETQFEKTFFKPLTDLAILAGIEKHEKIDMEQFY